MYEENEMVIKQIVGAIRKFVRAVSLDAFHMSKEYGLTGPQSSVLRTLINQGSLSSAALSRTLYVTPSNITGIIDRLEKKDLVERIRKEGDRRVAMITLTEKGEALSRTLPDPIEKRLISGLGDLESEHVRILALVMNQIVNLIDAKGVDEAFLELHQGAITPANEQ
ncbi:MAG: MarR family transcriptional regulator [Deltaproteobacteria bacterium]|nr:MarR family transcriptional regulator [Deltaproteobacteria bacterium]MBW2193407.1 MarR family transcriptional regulator [Deltaproteobacteria bacterium]